jgi:hypothetical protein
LSVRSRLSRRRLAAAFALALPALALARRASARHETLLRKHIVGYQGWFACPGDPDGDDWVHWFARGPDGRLLPTFDMLPDTAEFEPGEGCPTPWTDRAGRPVRLFSSLDGRTVRRHFRWMAEYDLHGAAVQRFVSILGHPRRRRQGDRMLGHARAAAEATGRGFFLMYDTSGVGDAGLAAMVEDWRGLVAGGLLESPAWQWHGGRPMLGVWGLGIRGRPIAAPAALAALADLRRIAGPAGLTILGGVPSGWRTGEADGDPSPAWQEVFGALDILSPWSVGRFADVAGADNFLRARIVPDLAATAAGGKGYMPVIFPGVSWHNLQAFHQRRFPLNQIARRCGQFYWRQAANAVNAGSQMLYTAMFDEVDEGTAILKVAPDTSSVPPDASMLTLDVDGCALPSDHYLRIARAVSAALRDGVATATIPSY